MSSAHLPLFAIVITAVTLVASPASADERGASSARAPQVELVEFFSETGQALIYDAHEREYVLLRKGSPMRDFEVAEISAAQIELFRPTTPSRRYVVRKPTHLRARVGVTGPSPTPPPATRTDAPIDPYGTPAPVVEPAPEPIKTVKAPVKSQPIPNPTRSIVSRRELDKALDDLEALSREVELELVPGGVKIIAIGQGSLPFRLGLRSGDVVRRVAGVPTTRLEDGADVFVKLGRVRSFHIEIQRGSHTLRLPVAVIAR